MTLGGPGNEQNRFRWGMICLAGGIALLLFAWLSWLYRASSSEGAPPPSQVESRVQSSTMIPLRATGDPQADRRGAFVRAAPMVLLVTFLVVVVFLGGSLVLVRGIRRHLAEGNRKRPPPTPNEDIWSMHRVPEDDGE